jgi:hypothetical protein
MRKRSDEHHGVPAEENRSMELESNLKYVSLNRMMKACRFLHILSTGCIAPWSTILAVTLRLRLCLRPWLHLCLHLRLRLRQAAVLNSLWKNRSCLARRGSTAARRYRRGRTAARRHCHSPGARVRRLAVSVRHAAVFGLHGNCPIVGFGVRATPRLAILPRLLVDVGHVAC